MESRESVTNGRLKGKNILVIDDEAGLREMLIFGLADEGCRVIGAASGREALEIVEKGSFDLAICDIMMPGMNGIDTLRGMKDVQPDIEVIMATGFATLQTAIDAMKAGAFDYIAKPYDLAQVRLVFAKAIEARDMRNRIIEMEEMNRMKSEFLVTKGRELLAPSRGIRDNAAELLSGVHGAFASTPMEIIRQIQVDAESLLRIVKSIADFSRRNV